MREPRITPRVLDPAAPDHRYRLPFQLWLSPSLGPVAGDVRHELRFEARSALIPPSWEPPGRGPAVVLVSPADLGPAHEPILRALLDRANPSRVVLHGGEQDRNLLLHAINHWRVFRVVPLATGLDALVDALRKAHDAIETGVALEFGVAELVESTRSLAAAYERLSGTRGQLLHAERLTTLGRLTSGLGLTLGEHKRALDGLEAVAGDTAWDTSTRQAFERGIEASRMLGTTLDELLHFANDRLRPLQYAPEDLDTVVSTAVRMAQVDPLARRRRFVTQLEAASTLRVDRYALYQVLLNLLRNAMQATRDDGLIRVRSARVRSEIQIEVVDDGVGMTEEVRERLFEPFFTTKGREGVGLGLRVSRIAIERHGGRLSCESEPRRGTTFCVTLPLERRRP
jgi:signal transduction histidine kinase